MISYEYEFQNKDEKGIEKLSNAMRFVGLFLNVLGWLIILGSLLTGWLDKDYVGAFMYSLPGVAIIPVAMWTNNAAKSFKKIIKAQGSDIKNLMEAFKEINNLYRFKFWLFFFSFIYLILVSLLS